MIKITLDKKATKYISDYFDLPEIKEIQLDSDSTVVLNEFATFILEMINNRSCSDLTCPYRYTYKSKTLEVFGRTRFDDIIDNMIKKDGRR